MFEPSRLKVARHRRSLSLAALASAAEISTRSLSAYEHGDTVPTPETITRLASALDFPVTFFEAGALQEPTPAQASFRSLASMTAGKRDAALSAGALAFELAAWITRRFRLPQTTIPEIAKGTHPELAADAVRAEWKLGDGPISHIIHLLEQHGCRVFTLADTARDVDAFSLWRDGTPFVFLNTKKSAEHSRMDAAHELGHLVLHRGRPPRDGDEDEAKAFAASFLLPRNAMLATVPRQPSLVSLLPHKRRWGVSLAAFVYRAHRVGLLSDWQSRELFVELSRKGYRKREPQEMPRETSQVLHKVFVHLRQRGRTFRDVANDLHLNPSDLEGLVSGLALVPIDGGAQSSAGPQPQLRGIPAKDRPA